jgi:hypothetical protein
MFMALLAASLRPTAADAGTGKLFPWETLYAGQQVTAGCHYRLFMGYNGDLITYAGDTPIWSAGTGGRGAYATMSADGHIYVLNWYRQVVWSAGQRAWCSPEVASCPPLFLQQENDGNVAIYHGGNPTWSSGVRGVPLIRDCAGVPETKTRQDWGYDRWGGDYRSIALIGAHEREQYCGTHCAQDSRCKSWTYVPPGVKGPSGFCFLKNTVPPLSRASGMVSGVVVRR